MIMNKIYFNVCYLWSNGQEGVLMEEREDKRIRRTKKLLRQALTRLMQQKDFQSITVTDVVREAEDRKSVV